MGKGKGRGRCRGNGREKGKARHIGKGWARQVQVDARGKAGKGARGKAWQVGETRPGICARQGRADARDKAGQIPVAR
jgi:hypothetical protein